MTYSDVAGGDIILASTINDLIRYGPAKPICWLQQQSGQSVSSGGSSALTFGSGSEIFDDLNWHSTSSNTSRITPTIAGRYKVTGKLVWAFNTTITSTGLILRKNGSTTIDASGNHKPNATNNVATLGGEVTAYVDMNGTTDYVEILAQQTSSGAASQTTNAASSGYSSLMVELERAA